MAEIVTADDGTQIDLGNVEQAFTWDGAFLSEITVVYRGKTFIQTFTNDGTHITDISNWQVQS